WVAWRVRGRAAVADRPTWDCGVDAPNARMEYTASGYAQPLEQVFHGFYAPRDTTDRRPARQPAWTPLARLRSFHREIPEPIWGWMYAPIESGTRAFAKATSRLQSGRIHAYLAYMFVTLIGLLLLIRVV
ncbi:oxidoreductase, partial [mine drainage metagenome]